MKERLNLSGCIPDPDQTVTRKTSGFQSITKEILSAFGNGDRRAFDTVYLCCFEPIRAFFRLLLHNDAEAEELCQDMFVRLWENRKAINPDLNFRAYLYVVAKTSAMKHLRHKQVRNKYVNFRLREDPEHEGAPDERMLENELLLLIRLHMEKMPRQRRKVFEMSRFDSMANDQIADRLDIRESTVRTHLHHALKGIKEEIEEEVTA